MLIIPTTQRMRQVSKNVKCQLNTKKEFMDAGSKHYSNLNKRAEGLAVASIARDVVVEMTPPRDDNAR